MKEDTDISDKFRDVFSDDSERGIKPSDKLNYRTVIQNCISDYLKAIGTFGLEKAVKSLRNCVFFNISGLPFRDKIIEKEKQLMDEYVARVVALIKRDRDSWLHPIKQAINDTAFQERFFMDLAEFLLELIAIHDGLVGIKGKVDMGVDEDISKGLHKKGIQDIASNREIQ